METKKLGFLILGMSIALGFVMFNFMGSLNAQGQQLHCNPTQECQQINSVLGVSHIAIGLLSFIFALGFYLLFFNKDEKEILEKYGINNNINLNTNQKNANDNFINRQKNNNIINNENKINSINDYDDNNLKNNDHSDNANNFGNNNDKFSLLLRPLDENERKVLIAIKGQKGITQSTLRYRADLSKAKVSQILADFEKKNLIERKAKGKTYSVFLSENF